MVGWSGQGRRGVRPAPRVVGGVGGVLLGFLLSGPRVDAQSPSSITRDSVLIQARPGDSLWGELGRLEVPERRSRASGPTIRLTFLRVPGTIETSGSPIVYLAGGPGGSAIDAVYGPRAAPILALRQLGDLILLDQRGTGRSEPTLGCPERFRYPAERPATRTAMAAAMSRFARECAAHWRGRGVDLAAYSTEASADDLQDLAAALGVSQVRLLGGSYGTHLALATIRRHPGLVERAVLVGPEGPDHTLKLPAAIESHFEEVARLLEEQCGTAWLDLRRRLSALASRLTRSPQRVVLSDTTGHRSRVSVSGYDVLAVAAALLGRHAGLRDFPGLFGPALRGDLQPLAAATLSVTREATVSAMSAAMDCASSVSATRRRVVAREAGGTLLGTLVDFPFPEWCEAWGIPPLDEGFRLPVRSDVPVLLVAGTLDGLTPAENAREIRETLTDASLVTVRNAGHDTLIQSPAVQQMIGAFLGSGVARDTIVEMPPFRFPIENCHQ